jgi:hypothetical protein
MSYMHVHVTHAPRGLFIMKIYVYGVLLQNEEFYEEYE